MTNIFFVTSVRIIKGNNRKKGDQMTPFIPYEIFTELIFMLISPFGRISEIFKTSI